MNNKIEFRFKPVDLNYNDEQMTVSGYVNLTEQFSDVMSTRHSRHGFVEKISKGAFERALSSGNDVDFLAEHDPNLILSSTRNNSLSLKEDDRGLFMSANISSTSWGRDYYTLVKDGILKNFSFGFRTIKDNWEDRSDGLLERTIEELELFEVSVVRNPAYPQSNIQARSLDVMSEEELEQRAKGAKQMDIKEKDLELRADDMEDTQDEGQDDIEDKEVDEENLIQSLERTVLALENQVKKMYDMLEEFFTEVDKEEEKKEDEDEEETDEATDDSEAVDAEEEEKEEDGQTRSVQAREEETRAMLEKEMEELRASIQRLE